MATQQQMAAQSRWRKTTEEQRKAHGQMMVEARERRFVDQVDPGRKLDEDVREELAAEAKALYYRSVQAKRRATIARRREQEQEQETLGSGDPRVPDDPGV